MTFETKRTRSAYLSVLFKFEPKIPCIDTSIGISDHRPIHLEVRVEYQNTGLRFGSGGSGGCRRGSGNSSRRQRALVAGTWASMWTLLIAWALTYQFGIFSPT